MEERKEDTSSLPGPSQVWSPQESSSAGPWGLKSHGGMAEGGGEEELGDTCLYHRDLSFYTVTMRNPKAIQGLIDS